MIDIFGFTYNGVHSSLYGCFYTPTATEQGRDMPPYSVEDIEVDGRDGGYYVGSTVKPREFNLDCFVEDITTEMKAG